jgi:hypothetical protein
VAFTTSVVTVTFSDNVVAGAAVGNVEGTLVAAAGDAALATGKVELGSVAEAPAAGTAAGAAAGFVTATGLNNDGLPLALFQPSYSKNSDIEKTTHNRVRRISFMGRSFQGRAAGRRREQNPQISGVWGEEWAERGRDPRDKTGGSAQSDEASSNCPLLHREFAKLPRNTPSRSAQTGKNFPTKDSVASDKHAPLPSTSAAGGSE